MAARGNVLPFGKTVKALMSDRQENEPRADTADLQLVLIGGRNSGKSSAGNTILGKTAFEIDNLDKRSTIQRVRITGKKLLVVDTPGWDFYLPSIPRNIKKETERGVSLCHPGPDGFLLTIPVGSDIMWSGLEEHMSLLGTHVWRYTIVLFTCGDRLAGSTIEEYISSQGEAFQRLLKKCRYRYHVFDNVNIEDKSQVHNLLKKIQNMRSENVQRYVPEICCLVEPDIDPEQEEEQTQPDAEGQKQNNRELGGENNKTTRDQGEKWILNAGDKTGNSETPKSTPAPALCRSRALLRETLLTAEVGRPQGRDDEKCIQCHCLLPERKEQVEEMAVKPGETCPSSGESLEAGGILRAQQIEEGDQQQEEGCFTGSALEEGLISGPALGEEHISGSALEAGAQQPMWSTEQRRPSAGRETETVMVVQLDKAAELLLQMHVQQVRGEAERHRVTEQMFAALKAQSAAVSQEFTTALSQMDQERDTLLAEMERLRESFEEKDREMERLRESTEERNREMERLRESTAEKDREMERLRESCVEKEAEIERLKEEVAKVKRGYVQTVDELEKNKRVLQQLKTLVDLVSVSGEGE